MPDRSLASRDREGASSPPRRCPVDELINKVSEKAGINPEQAKSAINTVLEFIKTKMPGVGDQVAGMLSGGGGGGLADSVGDLRKKFGV